ncbi:hypothetical protein BU23DRAFT_598039 [Bimuria novae-zelandiae CBS 107.79]|uniref:F-box domain-containing protein n=1 Tax=Bimuria novae-zelandiae CBS 107.79 TaxID=1447943 RepID=A0A6A5VC11_9PLEO|nr:hypothetical protein BU23DRAFT_598039 [Bimuria novae-zelandiae CBS 107.79]
MDRIPPEVYSEIVTALAEEKNIQLALYSTVSHQFCVAVEQQTFKRLVLTTHDLPRFREIFSGANTRRRGFLRQVFLRFVLPNEAPNPCCQAGRVIDRNADSQAFTESVDILFNILSDLRKRCSAVPPPLYLGFVNATRQSDPPHPNYSRCSRERGKHDEEDQICAKVGRGHYDFLPTAAKTLPTLTDVTEFYFGGRDELEDLGRKWIGLVLRKFQALEILTLNEEDRVEWGRKMRGDLREGLENSIRQLQLSSLKVLTLTIRSNRLGEESLTPPDLLYSQSNHDGEEKSSTTLLAHLSALPKLTTLQLNGPLVITPHMFSSLPPAAFPALKYFHLDFAPETADGDWFFQHDDASFGQLPDPDLDSDYVSSDDEIDDKEEAEEGEEIDNDDDDDSLAVPPEKKSLPYPSKYPNDDGPVSQLRRAFFHFRTLPSHATFGPLLLAAAEMAKNARCLRKFVMRVRHGLDLAEESNIKYVQPNMKRTFLIMLLRPGELCSDLQLKLPFDEEKYKEQNRMWWRVGDGWRPNNDVLQAWKEAVGEDGTVGFLGESKIEKEKKFAARTELFLGDPDLV